MTKAKQRIWIWVLAPLLLVCCITAGVLGFRASFPRPYLELVKSSGHDPSLVYAVIKAESGFSENARSDAGAVGLMQLMPATAEFVCEQNGMEFQAEKLCEGEYNVQIGCLYLQYLFGRFSVTETALCAYNAGEGTVSGWLQDSRYSADGVTLLEIPYGETRVYLKKIGKFRKIYQFCYR